MQPDSLREFVQRAYTKSIAVIWIVDTPLLGVSLILSEIGYCKHLDNAYSVVLQSCL
jgi:hypothetical protein